jgi:hypothetical protein
MIDTAMASELLEAWLPDFIAYAENPHHPLALDLLVQARKRVWDSYDANTLYDDPALSYDHAKEQIDYAASDVTTMLLAFAEWVVWRDREQASTHIREGESE